MNRHSQRYTLTLPANQKPVVFTVPGRYFLLLSSTLPVRVKFDDAGESEFVAGDGISLDVGDEFTRVELTATSALAERITFWLGYQKLEKSYISGGGGSSASMRTGSVAIANGGQEFDVAFATALSAPPAGVSATVIKAVTGDDDVFVQNFVGSPTAAGFRVRLSAPTPNANYRLTYVAQ